MNPGDGQIQLFFQFQHSCGVLVTHQAAGASYQFIHIDLGELWFLGTREFQEPQDRVFNLRDFIKGDI